MIELDIQTFFSKNKIFYYSDSVVDIDGFGSVSYRAVNEKNNIPFFNCREEVDYILDLTQDLESIWNNMNRNSRRNIRKAEKNGVTLKFNEGYEDFYNMYNDHLDVKKHIKWYNKHNLDDVKKYGTLVIAEYKNKIISGSVFLEDKDHIVYWITASYRYSQDNEIKQISGNATHLIQWEVIKYAKLKGIKEYNLGTCATQDKKNKLLIQFKESLGGKPYIYYIYDKDYNVILKTMREYSHQYDSIKINKLL